MSSSFDKSILFAWMLVGSGAGSVLYLGLNAQQLDAGGGGTAIQAVYSVFYVFFVALLAFSFREPLALIVEEKSIFILWLLAVVSTAWSVVPGTTLRRCVALLGTITVGLFMATRFDTKQQLRLISQCMGLTAVASFVVCEFFPDYGTMQTGEWTGVFYQKNGLGFAMALGVLCYTFLAVGSRRGRVFSVSMAIFCGIMLLMSRSIGALIDCTAMLMILPFRKFLILSTRRLIGVAAVLLAIGIPVGIFVMQNMDAILKALGRDPTLTGRTQLWQEVLDEIATRPWRGFGYSAFWFSSEGARIQAKLYWQMIHSHNGFLEVTLGLGIIGLSVLLISLVRSMLCGIRVARAGDTVYDFWPLFFLIFAVLDNLTESWFLGANSLLWMLLVGNSYWLVKKSLEPVVVEEPETEPDAQYGLGDPLGMNPAQS